MGLDALGVLALGEIPFPATVSIRMPIGRWMGRYGKRGRRKKLPEEIDDIDEVMAIWLMMD